MSGPPSAACGATTTRMRETSIGTNDCDEKRCRSIARTTIGNSAGGDMEVRSVGRACGTPVIERECVEPLPDPCPVA